MGMIFAFLGGKAAQKCKNHLLQFFLLREPCGQFYRFIIVRITIVS